MNLDPAARRLAQSFRATKGPERGDDALLISAAARLSRPHRVDVPAMRMQPQSVVLAVRALRSFGWLFLASYAAASIGLWVAHAAFPDAIGPVTDYTVSISAILALTFGGLYAAVLAIKPQAPRTRAPIA